MKTLIKERFRNIINVFLINQSTGFPVLLLNQLSRTSRTVWGTFHRIDVLLVSPVFMLAA